MIFKQVVPTGTKLKILMTDSRKRKFEVVDYEQYSETQVTYYLRAIGRYKEFDRNSVVPISLQLLSKLFSQERVEVVNE